VTAPRSLGAAQTVPVRGDVPANREQHVALAHRAGEAGARVLVFPELSLTGYELDLADALAFETSDARLAPLAETSAKVGVTLVVGAPVRVAGRLHIGAFVLTPHGDRALYTKHHLGAFASCDGPPGFVPIPEPSLFEPGTLDPLVAIGDGTGALAVCADTGHPSHAKHAAERGAAAYLAGVFTIPSDLETMRTRCRTHARRHAMVVVFANYGGPSGGLPTAGCSAIWSAGGELLGALEEAGAGVIVAVASPDGWRIQESLRRA
jgi:predicted amidohydrolase